MGKIKVLDGLRGYAALMVLFAHFPQVENSRVAKFIYHFVSYSKIGYLGVDFFFVLSGFLITRIIIIDKKLGAFSLKKFYKKRALRIFPVYYITLIIIGIFITWEKLFYTLTFTYNYSYPFEKVRFPFEHFWSLCVEEHFYIIFSTILYLLSVRSAQNFIQFVIPFLCVVGAFLTYLFFEEDIADKMVFSSSYCRIISLSFGAIFAFRENQIEEKLFSLKHYLSILSFMGILYVIGVESEYLSKYFPASTIRLMAFSFFSSLFFLIVLKLKNTESGLEKVFTNPAITFIAAISYGLYMYHYPIIYFFGQTYKDYNGIVSIKDACYILIISFLISIFSFFLFERPILRRFKK